MPMNQRGEQVCISEDKGSCKTIKPESKRGMPLSENQLFKVCKRGQGEETCRYLTHGRDGWGCGKKNPLFKKEIDRRGADGTLESKGDNCEGV